MNIVVDENIPKRTVDWLLERGHTVRDIRGTPEQGARDERLWDLAQELRALLASTDNRFSSTLHEPHFGVLIIRLRQPNLARIHERVLAAIESFPPESWPGQTVTMRDRVRSIRRSRPPA